MANSTGIPCLSFLSVSICDPVLIQNLILNFITPIVTIINTLFAPLGFIFNILIICIMPICNGVPPKAKAYYIAIAIFDLILVLFFHIMLTFPVAISNVTKRRILLPLFETISDLTCQINR